MKKTIEVIGLGAGDIEQLPLGIYRKLIAQEQTLFVRTADHPVIKNLDAEGIIYQSFDAAYESKAEFQAVYETIVQKLLQAAEKQSILYAVPGHPMLAEQTVQLLLEQTGIEVKIIGGQSYLDDLFTALKIDPIDGFQFVDGSTLIPSELNYQQHIVFCQVYDSLTASEVKLALLEDLPADFKVTLVEAVGTSAEKLTVIPLEELDRIKGVSNLLSVYVPPVPSEHLHHRFEKLREVIATLRSDEGCPWDKEQTHESLRPFAIEEVYELIDAINREDDEAIIEELGDVLLQVMLHSQIGEDNGYFTVDDVIRSITDKMIHRHPAVFLNDQSGKTWDELKQAEKPATKDDYILTSVIKEAPALQVALKLQRKAAKAGFNWSNVAEIWDKFNEESAEFAEALREDDLLEMENEFGDILFVLANIANFHKLNPELALQKANEKFIYRFTYIEKRLRVDGLTVKEAPPEKLEEYWQAAKKEGASDAFR